MELLKEYKKSSVIDAANQILLDYDFIGATERMDESIVVLKMLMLLGVPLGDALYLAAKNMGRFNYGVYKHEYFFMGLALLLRRWIWHFFGMWRRH